MISASARPIELGAVLALVKAKPLAGWPWLDQPGPALTRAARGAGE